MNRKTNVIIPVSIAVVAVVFVLYLQTTKENMPREWGTNFSLIQIIIILLLLAKMNHYFLYKKETKENGQKDFLAKYDEITGFFNRLSFIKFLDDMILIKDEEKFAIYYIDIDHFQKVNNALNHQAGDKVLKEISHRIKTVFNDQHYYAMARMSGDEFCILLPCENKKMLEEIASNLLKKIHKILSIDDYQFQISASIGIAIYPFDGKNAGDLIHHAEMAMCQAKQTRNSYQFFEPFADTKLNNKLYLESELRKAIKNNDFVFYYQPQVNCFTNELMGMEALMRWEHPEHGLITPDKFIPVAEETNLIVDLGKWGIKEAFTQLKKWHEEGHTYLKISINVSLSQLKDESFIQYVKEMHKKTKIPSHCITFEITESMMMDYQSLIPVLKELKELGFNIALDDFGTGYSSLSYIKLLPFDILKIDRSFVKDIAQNRASLTIVETIISLARQLGVDIIAEGIETKEQLELLKRKGCRKIQGYYYSKPIPASKFEHTLANLKRNIS